MHRSSVYVDAYKQINLTGTSVGIVRFFKGTFENIKPISATALYDAIGRYIDILSGTLS